MRPLPFPIDCVVRVCLCPQERAAVYSASIEASPAFFFFLNTSRNEAKPKPPSGWANGRRWSARGGFRLLRIRWVFHRGACASRRGWGDFAQSSPGADRSRAGARKRARTAVGPHSARTARHGTHATATRARHHGGRWRGVGARVRQRLRHGEGCVARLTRGGGGGGGARRPPPRPHPSPPCSARIFRARRGGGGKDEQLGAPAHARAQRERAPFRSLRQLPPPRLGPP